MLADLVKKHAPFKVISIILEDHIDPKHLEGFGEIKKFLYPELQLHVTKEDAQNILSKAMKLLPIEDIKIEDPQVEDIIRDVFTDANT